MSLITIKMTWSNVQKLPSPLKIANGTVRVNRNDPTRLYFEFPGACDEKLISIYGQIKVWLLDAICVSIQFVYEGELPIDQLQRMKYNRTSDNIWMKKEGELQLAGIPVVTAGKWIFSIENRTIGTKTGVPANACDINKLFTYSLAIDAKGNIVTSIR